MHPDEQLKFPTWLCMCPAAPSMIDPIWLFAEQCVIHSASHCAHWCEDSCCGAEAPVATGSAAALPEGVLRGEQFRSAIAALKASLTDEAAQQEQQQHAHAAQRSRTPAAPAAAPDTASNGDAAAALKVDRQTSDTSASGVGSVHAASAAQASDVEQRPAELTLGTLNVSRQTSEEDEGFIMVPRATPACQGDSAADGHSTAAAHSDASGANTASHHIVSALSDPPSV